MKTFFPKIFLLGLALATSVLGSGCSPQTSKSQTETSPPPVANTNTMVTLAETPAAAASVVAEDPVPPAPPAPLPSGISPSSPLAQVIRLTQAGVDQSIILTFVTNSSRTFNLDSERIIYLSDLGAPTELVTAMMGRDQQLQEQFAAAQTAQIAQQTAPPQPTEPAPMADPIQTNAAEVAAEPAAPPAPVTLEYLNTTLQPYGSWVVINGYGRCWRPTVVINNPGWQPYCDRGRWVYSDCGWYWNSDYAWGATFHYGRWFRDTSCGWCWYPDTVWAPSWVTWRYSDNYCGWAPLPPRTACQSGVGIVFNGGRVSVGFGFGLGANCYNFVPRQRFCDPNPRSCCVAPVQVTQIFNNTVVINNFNINNRTIINQGIAVQNIAAATHNPIRPVQVREINGNLARNHDQPHNQFGQAPGANRSDSSGSHGGLNRSRNETMPQDRFTSPHQDRHVTSGAPTRSADIHNQNQPPRDAVVATIPQHAVRPANDQSTLLAMREQNPTTGFQPPSAASNRRQADAPRFSTTRPDGGQNRPGALQNQRLSPPANNIAQPNPNRTVSPATTPRFAGVPNQSAAPRNPMATINPTRQVPVANYRPPTPAQPIQAPAANYRQPTAPVAWQQPASAPRNYAPQPSRVQNPVSVAQNQGAPARSNPRSSGGLQPSFHQSAPQLNSAANSPTFAVGQQGGNQRGPGH